MNLKFCSLSLFFNINYLIISTIDYCHKKLLKNNHKLQMFNFIKIVFFFKYTAKKSMKTAEKN